MLSQSNGSPGDVCLSINFCQKFIKLKSAQNKIHNLFERGKKKKKRLTSRDLSVFAAKSLFKRWEKTWGK